MTLCLCPYCMEIVTEDEARHEGTINGMPTHQECMLRLGAGSAAHILGDCDGSRGDPPGLTRRDAARLALDAYRALYPERGA